jgi:hypothetical protein
LRARKLSDGVEVAASFVTVGVSEIGLCVLAKSTVEAFTCSVFG